MSAEPAAAPGGLVHVGLIYDDVDELVAAVVPRVREALHRGDTVCMMVDRAVRRRVRAEIGSDAGRLHFPSPVELFQPDETAFLDQLRTWGRNGRGTLLVGQYSSFAVDARACRAAEDGINLLLGDLPITLVCACDRGGDEDLVATVRRSHPYLDLGGQRLPNPDFRPPVDRVPVPDRILGAPVLRVSFRGTADLRRIREQVDRVARGTDLDGEQLRAAVLAVHEAVVLACPLPSSGADPTPPAFEPERSLEVRVFRSAMVSEVTAPHGPDARPDDGDLLLPVRWWCDDVSLHETADVRTIRVRTDRSHRPADHPALG